MNTNFLEENNNLIIAKNNITENLGDKQNDFLQTNLGQAIDNGINYGLRILLPDIIEDEVVSVKDSLVTEGFSAAVSKAIEEASNLGKSLTGIVTGKFDTISQAQKAFEKGGLIDTVSALIDVGLDWAKENGLIKSSIAKTIKAGKNALLNTVGNKIEDSFNVQTESLEKIDKYIDKWKMYYDQKNFTNMEYQYKKIKEYLEQVMPLEETIKKARTIENLHERIKNNGKNFNISKEEQELAEML